MAAAAASGFGDASGLGFGRLTSQLPLPDADLDAALRKRLPNVTGFVSNSPGHADLAPPAEAAAAQRGPGRYQPLHPDTFESTAALVTAAGAAACDEAGDAVSPALPGPDFSRTTDRQGCPPNSEAAEAALVAARRLAAIGGEGDRLNLQPNMLLTRPRVAPGLIQPPHCSSPAVRDPEGYAARQALQLGAWRDRLCSAAADAVLPRPAGRRGVLEFGRTLPGDGAAAGAAGGLLRLQRCDLDYRLCSPACIAVQPRTLRHWGVHIAASLAPAAAACAGGDPVVTPCPSALAAAQALTGNSAQLPVSNAAFSGACTAGGIEGMLLITGFGCHQLASQMSLVLLTIIAVGKDAALEQKAGAVVLSNGNARIGAITSNTALQKTQAQGTGASSDPDMQALSTAAGYSQALYDQVLLMFDVTPTVSGPLAFQYVFGSEEYPDFAPSPDYPGPSPFNDVFGFFIHSGGGTHTNVALLPNSSNPVSINTVNALHNTYFIDNDFYTSTKATELNGLTTLIKTADYHVTAGTTYHVKLGIADGKDAGIDSIVWIKSGSVRFNIKDCVGAWLPHTWGSLNGTCTGACGGGDGLLPEVYFISVAAANACKNNNPCPVNCTASWATNGNCTGLCSGGSGFIPEVFFVSSPAMYGGSCPGNNGTSRLVMPCTNTTPCPPRNCVGSWVTAAAGCQGPCGGGAGLLLERYVVTVTAAYSGTQCPSVNGTTKSQQACNNNTPCPINCTGAWQVLNSSACTGHCSGGAGYVPETFVVSQAAMYGGLACPVTNNTVRNAISCTNSNPCPPVTCTGVWLAAGLCNGPCGGGAGLLPESFNITRQAAYGGASCSAVQSETRLVTACNNPAPCPINCVGNWTISGGCSGACEGGNGTLPEQYIVTTPAQHGGVPCPHPNGAAHSILACVNNAMCPVPCSYTWIQNGNCTGACGGGTGTLPQMFIINSPALYGGSCLRTNGSTRSSLVCINSDACPPVNCVGSFVNSGSCNGTCAGGAGKQRQIFSITTAAAWGGQNCSEAGGTQRFLDCNNTVPRACSGSSCSSMHNTNRTSTACVNNVPCPPRHCVGSWVAQSCSGACGGGGGLLLERYVITVTAAFNGTDCPELHGATKSEQACHNTTPCPINCTGAWQVLNSSICTGACDGGAGFIPETFVITQPAMYGGTTCSAANGTVQNAIGCVNNTPCPPVNCVGNWVPNGACVGGCGNVRLGGTLPESYTITTPALRNGTACPAENGDTRFITGCTNRNACSPVACMATWVSAGQCNGACSNGTGTRPEMYVISAPPVDNGPNCTHPNGTIRSTTSCINPTPCPVNCTGTWSTWTNCTAACAGGNQSSVYTVTNPARHNGSACEAANNTVRSQACNTQPCPEDCWGMWSNWTECSAACNTGYHTAVLTVLREKAHGGADCEAANNTMRNETCNTQPCPVPCVGDWGPWSECSAERCGGGLRMSAFAVTSPALNGGADCVAANNSVRNETCNEQPCPIDCIGEMCAADDRWIVPCVGSWSPTSTCQGPCGSVNGSLPEVFNVTTPAAHNGDECEAAHGDTRNTTRCATAPCPVPCRGVWAPYACSGQCGGGLGDWDEAYVVSQPALWDIVLPDSPPVLPPLNMTLNDSGVVIKGGNVTISGMKIEGVAIKGVFVLTREESVNNVTTNIQTLRPRVSGYLKLWSKAYPGPGFSGRYDWSGELELAPDPFTEWQDAASLLVTDSSSNSSSMPDGHHRRSLLQDAASGDNDSSTSTGMVPVQGRVGIRESRAPVDPNGNSSPGTVTLDDTGDIVLICLNGVCPPSLTGKPGQGETPGSTQDKPAGLVLDLFSAFPGTRPQIILLAAILVPAGLAICATGIVAVVLRKRRKQKEEEQAREGTNKRKRADDQPTERQEQQLQLEGRQSLKPVWRSADGTSWVPGTTQSSALLRRSSIGTSINGSGAFTDADLALQLGPQGTSVERLQPGETGFGSNPGNVSRFAAMAALPPSRDSADGCAVERSRGSKWSLAGSLANAMHLRSSQSGDAYRVAEPRINVQASGGSSFSNFHPFANNAPGHAVLRQPSTAAAAAGARSLVIPAASPAQLATQRTASLAAEVAMAAASRGSGGHGRGRRSWAFVALCPGAVSGGDVATYFSQRWRQQLGRCNVRRSSSGALGFDKLRVLRSCHSAFACST
ncbi:hypothetical protein COO60DRAFT_1461341 [Scenedesmus sp. NREL 46B-D3]|nr:hypothetical protein COO60DRAFT_1461341 [Scenedesmus sp. NREL 46B-D3]